MSIDNPTGTPSEKITVAIDSNAEGDRLNTLLKEYELCENSLEQIGNRIIEIIGFGTGVLGLVAGFILTQQKSLPLGIAWLSPFVFFMFFALVLHNTYLPVSKIWELRVLSWRVNALLSYADRSKQKESSLIVFERNSPGGSFFSVNRGNWKLRIVYFVLIVGSIFLFLVTIFTSFQLIFASSHLQATVFLFLNVLLTILGLIATSGILTDLHDNYNAFLIYSEDLGHIPYLQEFDATKIAALAPQRSSFYSIIQFLIPREWDFLVKFLDVVYGILVALATVGLQSDQLPTINFLFRPSSTTWTSAAQVPLWAILSLGLIYLLIEELLLQQAKLLWDDIRDFERDKLLPLNSTRAIASGRMSRRSAVLHMLVRWVLAFFLGYAVGGLALLLLFMVISLHQVLYELWAKPHAGKHPLVALFVLSFNVALRFLAGALAIVGSHWTFSPLIFVFVAFYFASLGGMANIWKLEGEHLLQTRGDAEAHRIKPQSNYFVSRMVRNKKGIEKETGHGIFWQHVGLTGAVVFSLVIPAIHINVCTQTIPFISPLYGTCVGETGVNYVELGSWPTIGMIFALIGVFVLGSSPKSSVK